MPARDFFCWRTGSAELIEQLGLDTSEVASISEHTYWPIASVHQNVAIKEIVEGKMQQRRNGGSSWIAHVVTNGKVVCRIQTAVYLPGL